MVVARPLRIVFFGTPAFAVPTLDGLLDSRHAVVGVVTQPDRPRGRGHKTIDAPVKARATAAGVLVLQPDKLRDLAFLSALRELRPDLGIVAAYGKILPEAVLGVPPMGMLNVHASLLPRYRGAAPIHRAVMAGDRQTGVTIMRIVKALDAGPMLARESVPIGGDETSEAVETAVAHRGAALLVTTVERLAEGPIEEVPQDEALATYAPRLTKEDGMIDWAHSARQIHDRVRGLYPWPHAYSFLNGRRLILLRTAPAPGGAPPLPGTIVAAHGDDLVVATGEGLLRILQLQAEGKRPTTAREFLAGHQLKPGDRFDVRP